LPAKNTRIGARVVEQRAQAIEVVEQQVGALVGREAPREADQQRVSSRPAERTRRADSGLSLRSLKARSRFSRAARGSARARLAARATLRGRDLVARWIDLLAADRPRPRAAQSLQTRDASSSRGARRW
jgi:hypothetical protein